MTTRLATKILGTLACLSSAYAKADGESKSADRARLCVATFYYGNGVDNSIDQASDSLESMARALARDGGIDCRSKPEKMRLAYNHTGGVWEDFKESFFQKLIDAEVGTVRTIKSLFAAGSGDDDIARRLVREAYGIDPMDYAGGNILKPGTDSILDRDMRDQLASYRRAIDLDKSTVVVVAHSQGNLFANHAYRALSDAQRRAMNIVAVATPASYVADDFRVRPPRYATLKTDVVIAMVGGPVAAVSKVEGVKGALASAAVDAVAGLSPLPANVSLSPERAVATMRADVLSHSFVKAYLANEESRRFIVEEVLAVVEKTALEKEQVAAETVEKERSEREDCPPERGIGPAAAAGIDRVFCMPIYAIGVVTDGFTCGTMGLVVGEKTSVANWRLSWPACFPYAGGARG